MGIPGYFGCLAEPLIPQFSRAGAGIAGAFSPSEHDLAGGNRAFSECESGAAHAGQHCRGEPLRGP
jgi:hypothetical protein